MNKTTIRAINNSGDKLILLADKLYDENFSKISISGSIKNTDIRNDPHHRSHLFQYARFLRQ